MHLRCTENLKPLSAMLLINIESNCPEKKLRLYKTHIFLVCVLIMQKSVCIVEDLSTKVVLRLCKVSNTCREDPKTSCTLGVHDFDVQVHHPALLPAACKTQRLQLLRLDAVLSGTLRAVCAQ